MRAAITTTDGTVIVLGDNSVVVPPRVSADAISSWTPESEQLIQLDPIIRAANVAAFARQNWADSFELLVTHLLEDHEAALQFITDRLLERPDSGDVEFQVASSKLFYAAGKTKRWAVHSLIGSTVIFQYAFTGGTFARSIDAK